MKTLKEFIPLRSKVRSKNLSCYYAYLAGYKECEDKYKQALKELENKFKKVSQPWLC